MVKIKLCKTVCRYPLQQGLNLNIAKLGSKKSTIQEIFTPRYQVSFGDWPMEVQRNVLYNRNT